ncbi:hypothetical protein GCM10010964_08920 [Caldovatus sediminis]|uniref:Transposase DDE domain-containing protein n=1 Tax=Caldovatus sediminis TaxID=2041189 RepID=A0A8J3ECK9_9PROT|nr:hypothetical protein GCM10010964_08920 [Caldovatus sediminis]
MTGFIPFSRDRAFLLPPDAQGWLPADDAAHCVVAAVERVALGALAVRPIPGGRAQDHPRRPLALIYAYADGIFSSRRIEPVFGIIKSALGFARSHLRGLANVTAEWTLIALAYNGRRLHRLRLARPQTPPPHAQTADAKPTGC